VEHFDKWFRPLALLNNFIILLFPNHSLSPLCFSFLQFFFKRPIF
jgi:hypothetical protein